MEFNELLKKKTRQKFLSFDSILAPPPSLTVSQFACKDRIISLSESEQSGLWVDWPFQTEMQNVFNEKGVRFAVFMTSAQISKTAQELNIIGYIITYRHGGITFMLPTKTMAEDYSKARFDSMVEECKPLKNIIPPTRSRGNRTLFKKWSKGYIRFIGSENANDVCSFPSAYVLIDEADRCSLVVRNSKGEIEGNTLKLLIKRMSRFDEKFLLMASTPTTVETSLTWEHFKNSDQRHPHIACPHCGFEQFLDWENFSWHGKNPNNNTVVIFDYGNVLNSFCYICSKCKQPFTDEDLPKLPEKLPVKWVKHNPEGKFPGFHINQFYTNSWKELFAEYLECGENQIKLMSFWNTVLGLPFSFEGIKVPDWNLLYERPKHYDRGVVPYPACVLLAGCDVQDNRVEIVVAAFNRSKMFIVDHAVFYARGRTDDRDDPCWENLRDFTTRPFISENGYKHKITGVAIDARHRKDVVNRFCKKNPLFIPVTGSPGVWDQEVLNPRRAEINIGKGIWREIALDRYPLGVNLLKMDLYGRLNLQREGDNDSTPSDWIDFPAGLPEEFYKQLTGEILEINEDSRGKTSRKWRKEYQNVEILDCMGYILGLYQIKSLHNWSEDRWDIESSKTELSSYKQGMTNPHLGSMITN